MTPQAQNPDTTRWFIENLQPHESMLRAWLRSQFGSGCDLDDIVQEAFLRVLQAWLAGEVRSPKAFLFVTARNLALMRARRVSVAKEDPLEELDHSRIMDKDTDIPHAVARAEELEILADAIQSLPNRCRQILTLRKIYGLSQKETAAEMGIAEHTVEIQSTLALKKLNAYFRRHAAPRRGI